MSEKILEAIGPLGRPILEIVLIPDDIGYTLWLRRADDHQQRVMLNRSMIPQLITGLENTLRRKFATINPPGPNPDAPS